MLTYTFTTDHKCELEQPKDETKLVSFAYPNDTHDFRMVSAFFLILRILIVASFLLRHWSHLPTSEFLCVVFIGTCCSYQEAKQIEQ